MTLDTFFEHFDRFAEAPNAVAKMRELILQLAVQGKLVEQDSSEGDGQTLLSEIQEIKQRLIADRRYKRTPKLENLCGDFNEGMPEIPPTWVWSKLVDIGEISPKNDAADDLSTSFIPMNAISEHHTSIVADEERLWGSIKKGYTHVSDGDVVLAKITPCFENGKAAVIGNLKNGIGAGTTELHVVRPIKNGIDPRFIYVFLRSPYFKSFGEMHMTGTAGQKRLPTEYFATRPLPVPPLAEQKRIVAKVDELMALCDKLEAQQRERDQLFPLLSQSAHARFAASPTPENLETLFAESVHVSPDDVRKTILDLALKGRLVSQEKGDKPAIESINEIKQTLISATKRGKKGQSLKLKPPYELPQNWTWSTFPMLGEFGRGKSKHRPRNDSSLYVNGVYPLVQTGDVSRSQGSIKTYTGMYNEKGLAQSKLWPAGTLCITIAANIADTGILEFEACFPDSVVGFIPSDKLPSVRYFEYFMRTAKDRLMEFAPATAQKNINLGILEQVLIPVPPLAEQKRIVAKVDELMSVVDRLEKQQQQATETAALYAQTVVAEITGTEIKEQEKMKAPKTELVTRLEPGKKPKASDIAPLTKLITQHNGLSAKALWQQSGLEIDAFYQQLKTEMANGWIIEPEKASMKEIEA